MAQDAPAIRSQLCYNSNTISDIFYGLCLPAKELLPSNENTILSDGFKSPVSCNIVISGSITDVQPMVQPRVQPMVDKGILSHSTVDKDSVPHPHGGSCTLPPCHICGDFGDGIHYGVNTCRSCGQFFQRASVRKIGLRCKANKCCEITRLHKTACPACRYQRCLRQGMSRKAIRTGRYTHAKRTMNTQEVQKLQLQGWVSGTGELKASSERDEELDNMIDRLTDIHVSHMPCRPEFINQISTIEAQYMENQYLKESVFGCMNTITKDEYNQIYQNTGLDVDGRKAMYEQVIVAYVHGCQSFAKFLATLPGFTSLPMPDQIVIVDAVYFKCDLMTAYHTYNSDLELMTFPDDLSSYGRKEIGMFYNEETLEMFADCATNLQQLDLTPEEAAIILSYLVVTTDVDITEEGRHLMLAMQEVISDAMCRLFHRNHDDYNHFLSRVISVVLKINVCEELVWEQEDQLCKQFADVKPPELTKELLGL